MGGLNLEKEKSNDKKDQRIQKKYDEFSQGLSMTQEQISDHYSQGTVDDLLDQDTILYEKE